MASATQRAIAAVAACGAIQWALWCYALSYSPASELVTASFLLIIGLYPVIFAYPARQMKAAGRALPGSAENSS